MCSIELKNTQKTYLETIIVYYAIADCGTLTFSLSAVVAAEMLDKILYKTRIYHPLLNSWVLSFEEVLVSLCSLLLILCS